MGGTLNQNKPYKQYNNKKLKIKARDLVAFEMYLGK